MATDYLLKGKQAEKNNERLQAISFYFQALRSIEKYLGEPIRVTMEDREVLLGNEIYASLQTILNKINIHLEPVRNFSQSQGESVCANCNCKIDL